MLVNGIINLLKPSDMSSNQALGHVKRIMQTKKAGHSGTLDPEAAGVLPVFLGKATRVVEYAMDGQKEYIAEIHFGMQTDTQDAQGRVVKQSFHQVDEQDVRAYLKQLPGEHLQTPPMYSAIKQNGVPLYAMARKGVEREIPPRKILIDETEFLARTGGQRFLFRVVCSKGTYVRTLCQDMGAALHACAHLSFLLRTRTGGFSIAQAVTLQELEQAAAEQRINECLLDTSMALTALPICQLRPDAHERVIHGKQIRNCDLTPQDLAIGTICQMRIGHVLYGTGQRTPQGVDLHKMLWEGQA